MRHDILLIQAAILGVLAVYFLFRGFVAYLRWSDERFQRQLEADFRAHVLVEEAKREVSQAHVSDCELPGMWSRSDFMGGKHG
ncbi:hypothetical protein [uncultured Xanthomonas sp.]|uniref:hypothetical protein n=1 Tax=uncultured Xanthomonas sp. TaxID=152831 RepID=UPI0025D0EFE1|nr:hypothetical protein [uncultured Xanthomonas sp.]